MLNAYVQAKDNHLTAFHYGFSFLILSIGSLIYLLCYIFNIKNSYSTLSLQAINVLAWWFQLDAIVYIYFIYKKKDCRIKRLSRIIIKVLTIAFFFILSFWFSKIPQNRGSFDGSLKFIGYLPIDLYFRITRLIIISLICFFIPKRAYFNIIFKGYILIFISKISLILNLLITNYNNSILYQLENSLSIMGFIFLIFGILNIYKKDNELEQ